MGVEIDTSGFDELKRKLNKIDGTNKVPFSDLFPTRFLTRYTEFEDLEDMEDKLEENGFSVETEEDFDNIPEDGLDSFINKHTKFSNWEEILGTAFEEWISKQLGF